ncbi:hypothetical protein L1280_003101 [Deinococcus sp. HSC-46F16]|uniref:sacsin N-terminal ATP-binding-like domain-containing protein n=1 Tax=Deinococcus sp. HSC-46F16 TaxID=2910968 RepID=UPI0020A21AE1|nr:hypothetical protein [Deinococcus sp. HSC-46F16]MCP2015918.1 hypothetical protein [Deinococcus sp. HSC-46F16]
MAGIEQSSATVLKFLRNLFNDQTDELLIIKELLQNADDSGATRVVIGCSDGLPQAAHPLLRGPALFSVNDGPFRPEDARAIITLGLSTKGGDASTVGKFGLGLKSAFYLAEALFFMDSRLDPEEVWRKPHFDVLSPWVGGDEPYRPDWVKFTPDDRRLILEHLGSLGLPDGFIVWIPLRRETDCLKAGEERPAIVVRHYPGDKPFAIPDRIQGEIGRMLPMMGHVCEIGLKASPGPAAPVRLFKRVGTGRTTRLGEGTSFTKSFGGGIQDLPGPTTSLYVGAEVLSPNRDLLDLSGGKYWPTTEVATAYGEEFRKDPSVPHGAVVWQRTPSNSPQLQATWSVFLPVEDALGQTVPLPGPDSYALTLHGYFFLRPDRKSIYGLHRQAAVNTESEEWVREQWNGRLAETAVLPHVLKGLADITSTADEAVLGALTQALVDSRLGQGYRHSLTAHHQWARVVRDGHFQWSLLPVDAAVLPLAQTPETTAHAAALETLTAPLLLRDVGSPAFLREERRVWPTSLLDALLERYNLQSVLLDPERTRLLLALGPYLPVAEHRRSLVQRFRTALLEVGFAALGKQREEVASLLSRYLGSQVLSLPAEGMSKELTDRLMGLDINVILVPDGFASRQQVGSLDANQANALLDMIQEVDDIAPLLRFVKRHLHTALDFEQLVLDRPLLPTNQGSQGVGRWLSLREALTLAQESRIFRQQREESVLLTHLRDVLGETSLHFVPGSVLTALEVDQAVIPRLSIKAVLDTLRGARSLGEDTHRLKLLHRILTDAPSVSDALENRGVLRLLLHGRPEHATDVDQTLLVTSDPKGLWGKIARLAGEHSPLDWTVVQPKVDFLSPKDMKRLGVVEADVQTVVPLLHAAAANFPGHQLTAAEREELILQLTDDALLQRLPIFTTVDRQLTAIGQGVYLEGGLQADTLVGRMTLLRKPEQKALHARLAKLAPPLSHRSVWDFVLNDPEPWHHWPVLSEALRQMGTAQPQRAGELPWWPLQAGGGVAPKDVLLFAHQESREEIRRLRDAGDIKVPVQEDLSADFNRQFFPGLLRLTAPEDKQRETLLGLVRRARGYHVGSVAEPSEVWLKAFEGVSHDDLPVVGLLEAFGQSRDMQAALLSAAAQPVTSERLLWMLERLHEQVRTKGKDVQPAVERVYPSLLADLRLQHVPAKALSRLHFLNEAGQWCKAEDLVAFGPQFDPKAVLNTLQAEALYGGEKKAEHDLPVRGHAEGDVSVDLRLKNGAQDLRRHLGEWEQTSVPREQLGAFLGLLDGNPVLHHAAQPYLVTFDLGVLRENAFRDVPSAALPRDFKSYQAMHDQIRLLVTLHKGQTTRVLNLLGEPLEVAFQDDQKITSLFTPAAGQRPFRHGAHFVYPVEFKVINLRAPDIDYPALLFQSLHWVLNHYLKVTPPHLREEFDKVVNSNQATVAATQNRLIKVASQTWGRQLGVARGSAIRDLLQQIETADRSAEQARDQGAKQVQAQAEARIRQLQSQLKQLVEEDRATQQALLQGVRGKITDMQYTPGSVPFELLQNADDALSEWEEMTGRADDVRRTFHADLGQDALRFIHHGRPVNFFSYGEFDGRGRGFDGDLEKMLTLMSSDKGAGVTGKFGLGFKSVFLLSDRPTVKSGRLAFTVKGGVYPVTPDEQHVQKMRRYLERVVPAELQDATLVELPLVDQEVAAATFEHFSKLAPFALAFTRALRRLQLRDAKGTRHHEWKEQIVAPGVAVMTLQGAGENWRGLALHSPDFKLLLPLGPLGLGKLDSEVPNLWVTAPTAERLGLPFLLHASFPLDTGRAQLARNEAGLSELVERLRPGLQAALETLLDLETKGGLNERLGWPAKAKIDLPALLWQALALPLSREDSNPAFGLLRDLLWGEQGAYGALTLRRALIPNGLPEGHAATVKAGQAGTRTLDFPPALLAQLGKQAEFRRAYPAQGLLSPDTARVLQRLGLPVPQAELTLPEVLKTLLPDRRVGPEQASWLAPVLSEDVVEELREDEAVSDWLDALTFRTRAGGYARPVELLMAAKDGDEAERFPFAPANAQLADAYDAAGIVLFRRLRGEAHQHQTVGWLLAAKARARLAALKYIANQVPSGAVLTALRLRLTGSWLEHTQLVGLPEWAQLDEAQQRDVLNALRQTKEVFAALPPPPPTQATDEDEESEQALRLPPDFLHRLVAWWRQEGTAETQRYNERLYPSGVPFVTGPDYDSNCPGRRRAWLSLLMLGSLQSMGRTLPEAHRNFLALCAEKGWLDAFSAPDAPDERWMDSLRTYLTGDAEVLKYYQWMRGFVGFYQLGHWLDTYVEVLLQLEYAQPRSLRLLLAPNVNPDLQGSGIDAPPLTRTLGMGAPFVVRELLRGGALRNPKLAPLAYVPTRRVRLLMSELMRRPLPQDDVEAASRCIHTHLAQTLGEAQATFGGQYDLPLHILLGSGRDDTTALALQQRVLGRALFGGSE